MITVDSDKTAFFDVDDTLIKFYPTFEEECASEVYLYGTMKKLVPMNRNIEQLKLHKLRLHKTVVWSAGGYQWAYDVIKSLKLEKYVDVVMSKPAWVYDDLPVNEFMPKNQWFKDE